ncbi:MAG: hypothetical protein KC621_26995 [Myxococcales bacterium]|nr:hypothetical protein [Myxococcales bacterium]
MRIRTTTIVSTWLAATASGCVSFDVTGTDTSPGTQTSGTEETHHTGQPTSETAQTHESGVVGTEHTSTGDTGP